MSFRIGFTRLLVNRKFEFFINFVFIFLSEKYITLFLVSEENKKIGNKDVIDKCIKSQSQHFRKQMFFQLYWTI